MKKTMKKVAFTGMAALALFGAGTGVAFASGYITWNGTEDYNEILQGLDDMERRHNELGGERSQMIRELIARTEIIENKENELRDKENELLDKDNQIDSLNQQIEALEKRIESGQTTQDQLQQAEKDMKNVNKRTQEVLKNMSDAFSK